VIVTTSLTRMAAVERDAAATAALPRSKVLVLVIFHDLLQRPLFLNIHAITCLLLCAIPIVNHFDVLTRDHDLNGLASIDLGGGKLRSCVS
jgi:hypothetical protein